LEVCSAGKSSERVILTVAFLLFAIALEEIIANDRVAQRKRHPQNVFHQRGALLEALVDRIGFRLLLCDHCADILQKIDAALFTLAARALLVVARGAFVTHRVVATLAEARHFAHIGAALRAFHRFLRRGRGRSSRRQRRCRGCLGRSRIRNGGARRRRRFVCALGAGASAGLASGVRRSDTVTRHSAARLPRDRLVRSRTAHAEILQGAAQQPPQRRAFAPH